MKPRSALPGRPWRMELLAKGGVDYGLTFISEIITEPGGRGRRTGCRGKDISTLAGIVAVLSARAKAPEGGAPGGAAKALD